MTLSWTILLVFCATAMVVVCVGVLVYEWGFRYRLSVQDRINELSISNVREHKASIFKDVKQFDKSDINAYFEFADDKLTLLINQAGMSWNVKELGMLCLVGGFIGSTFVLLPHSWLICLTLPIGAISPVALLFARRRMRSRKLSRQLPEAFQMISRAVRAGQTLTSSLKMIAEDFEAPISEEFALCYEQQNHGMSSELVFRKLASRTEIIELQMFVVAMMVQTKSGGDLVGLLDNLAVMIRKRLTFAERVRALTGEGRMQAIVLLVLPVLALVGIFALAPDYAGSLLGRPWLLAGTATAQGLGAMWIHKIVNFEY